MTPEQLVNALGTWSSGIGPLYRQLASGIRMVIESGQLDTGAALPAERKLADALSVSRTTVASAYAILRADGWVDARQGAATTITAGRHSPVGGHRASALFATLLRDHPDVIDLTIAVPGAAPIVREVLANPTRHILETHIAAGHGYNPLGAPALREALAENLTHRGLDTTPEQLLITSGAQQALSLAVQGLTRPGDAVGIEEISYPGAIDAIQLRGARPIPIRMGPDGLDPDALVRVVHEARPRLLYLIPTFHNPSGTLLDGARRRHVAAVIAESKTTTIDDLSLAELDYGQPAPPPLAALEPDAPIVTVGGMSKVFWGGIRIGWIRAHEPISTHLAGLKTTADLGAPETGQHLAAAMLGAYDETRAWRNERLAESLAACRELLGARLPDWTFQPPLGGPHLWVRVPGTDTMRFAQHAIRRGVAVVGGGLLSVDGSTAKDRIRLPLYAEPARHELAIDRLAAAWSDYRGVRGSD